MFKHTRIDKQYIDYLHLRCKYGMIGGNPSMYDSEMGRYSSGSLALPVEKVGFTLATK
jgi:hypothetical protein